MPRSYRNGNYRLIAAVEAGSRADSWYRVLQDVSSEALSCDCAAWIMNQSGSRSCKHTEFGRALLRAPNATLQANAQMILAAQARSAEDHPLVAATREQWFGGVSARWGIEERETRIGGDAYHAVLLAMETGDQVHAHAVVAFNARHSRASRDPVARMVAGVAGWAGYEMAAQLARAAGFPLAGAPPDHYTMPTRQTGGGRGARAPQPIDGRLMPEPEYGLADILRVGERTNLGDGLTPEQRAEATLRLFLGDYYNQWQRDGYLDVPSRERGRVYRLRRDPHNRSERRVRVFDGTRWVKDWCIVRAQQVPLADHLLTLFLGLTSDERRTIEVVRRGNVFSPHSDDHYDNSGGPTCLCGMAPHSAGVCETTPPQWRARTAA
jgi:hypothetical protein